MAVNFPIRRLMLLAHVWSVVLLLRLLTKTTPAAGQAAPDEYLRYLFNQKGEKRMLERLGDIVAFDAKHANESLTCLYFFLYRVVTVSRPQYFTGYLDISFIDVVIDAPTV